MKVDRNEALVILEMIGSNGDYQGNTVEEENLETKIRASFINDKEVTDYDYLEQKKKHGW